MNFKEEQELRSSIRSLIRYVKTKRLNEESQLRQKGIALEFAVDFAAVDVSLEPSSSAPVLPENILSSPDTVFAFRLPCLSYQSP